ncbi:hypothetical protein H2200_001908 [Cladophialophora chaetospira]|uniref:Clr5 domain-containing protein n=1 Tax=Cladophialophora chaetospira TaxID=386627 RepID=A0AA38XLU9_9EURO|nr:hypothetical protein H2200_001908 [Cladophialophora chaetospira]
MAFHTPRQYSPSKLGNAFRIKKATREQSQEEITTRPYNPSNPGNASRIKNATWEEHRDEITTLRHKGCCKTEILAVLKSKDFEPSYAQLRRRIEKWDLNAHADETEISNLPTASDNAVNSRNLEDNTSIEPCNILACASVVTPDNIAAPSSQDAPIQSLHHFGSFVTQKDCTSGEIADPATPSEPSLPISERLEFKAQNGQKAYLADALPRNSLELPPLRCSSALSTHDIASASSARSSVDSLHNERRSSQFSPPPLTLSETPSTDGA